MIALFDTDVVLDLFLDRQPFAEAAALMFSKVGILGINTLEFVGIGFSYLLLFFSFLNLRYLKINLILFVSTLFCLYSFSSIIWGSQIRNIAQITFPFILIISGQIFVSDYKKIRIIITALILGSSLPIFISVFNFAIAFPKTDCDIIFAPNVLNSLRGSSTLLLEPDV